MEKQAKMSFFAAVLMSMNVMIGAGVLFAVAPMTGAAGGISFLEWPIMALLIFPIIWSLAQAAQLFPGEGGFYYYCSTGINPTAGVVANWAYLLGYMGTAASVATVLRAGLAKSAGIAWIQEYPILFNLILAALYTAINLIPLQKISRIQSAGTLLKITPLVSVIALMSFYLHSGLTFDLSELRNIGLTASTVMFAYWGFESCCSIGGLLKGGPQRVGPVMLIGFFATVLLYSLFHIGTLYIMGPENLATYGAIAFPRFLGLSPSMGALLEVGMAFAILFSWANSILGVSLANITNIDFMARKKILFASKTLSTENRNGRPIYAALAHGIALFAFITFISDSNILFALTNLGVLTTFVLALLAVFFAHVQTRNLPQLAVVILAFGSCAILFYYSILQIPSIYYAMPLIAGIALGLVMFKIQGRRAALAVQEVS